MDDDFFITYSKLTPGQINGRLAGPSNGTCSSPLDPETRAQLEGLNAEIESVVDQIKQLQALKKTLLAERDALRQQSLSSKSSDVASSHAKPQPSAGVDYNASDFPWSDQMRYELKNTFGIENFRLCQEAVCNAALDSRDSVVVMPTGGGKSLTYQLPAIMSVGLTLVVSPLISLMTDQVLHLQELGICSELLSGAVSREESAAILRRVKLGGDSNAQLPEIKLLYVTPERVAKSKTLLAAMQNVSEKGRLARIVIDEAHCCSQMGHDYRPDYKKLSLLRKLFPEVPIMCLTATCGPKVLTEILNIVGLEGTTEAQDAAPNRTIYFTAPLYRENLIYSVLQKPASAQASSRAICDYILENHAGRSGIVYCLSKKDTQAMADSLAELSQGQIRTGVYHADLDDGDKHQVHLRWRKGSIQVVCATIAFGMGIDKGDVAFVIHACISKSLDGYYQETGRAGRDGKDASCVLMYRPQDATRISSLVAGEPTGQDKLFSMLSFAQSTECRKLLFSRYFVDSFGGPERCGRCDNCTNPKAAEKHDVISFQAWQILQVTEEVHRNGGRVTLAGLADLSRALGGGQYPVVEGKGRGKKGKGKKRASGIGVINLQEVAGGKVDLSKDNCERLVVDLLLNGYLGEEYQATAYTVNVYIKPGPKSIRLSRLSLETAQTLQNITKISFVGSSSGFGGGGGGGGGGGASSSRTATPRQKGKTRTQNGAAKEKRKRVSTASGGGGGGAATSTTAGSDDTEMNEMDDEDMDEYGDRQYQEKEGEGEDDEDEDEDEEGMPKRAAKRRASSSRRKQIVNEGDSDEWEVVATTSSKPGGNAPWSRPRPRLGGDEDPIDVSD